MTAKDSSRLVLNIIAITWFFTLIFVILLLVSSRLDPIQLILRIVARCKYFKIPHWIFNDNNSHPILIVFLLFVCLIGGCEAIRSLAIVFTNIFLFITVCLATIRHISPCNFHSVQISSRFLVISKLTLYTKTSLIIKQVEGLTLNGILFLVAQDAITIITFAFSAICLWREIGFHVTIVFTVNTLIGVGYALNFLTYFDNCLTKSRLVSNHFKLISMTQDGQFIKYLCKKIFGLQPFKFSAGIHNF